MPTATPTATKTPSPLLSSLAAPVRASTPPTTPTPTPSPFVAPKVAGDGSLQAMADSVRAHLSPDFSLSDLNHDGTIDLDEILVQTYGKGFASRVVAGKPSDEDQQLATQLLGTSLDETLMRKIREQFLYRYYQDIEKQQRAEVTPTPQPQLPGAPTVAPAYPPQATPSVPFAGPQQHTTALEQAGRFLGGMAGPLPTAGGSPPLMPQGADSLAPMPLPTAGLPGASASGAVDRSGSTGVYPDLPMGPQLPPAPRFIKPDYDMKGNPLYYDGRDGKLRAKTNAESGMLEPTGDTTSPDWQEWFNDGGSANFTEDERLALREGAGSPFSEAKKRAKDLQLADLKIKQAEFELAVAERNAPVDAQLKLYEIEAKKAATALTNIDIEDRKLQLAMQPLVKERYEMENAKLRRDEEFAAVQQPLQLEQLQLSLANTRAEVAQRNRDQRQKQATDKWAAEAYPQMLGLFTSVNGAPNTSFDEMAAGAGTTPDDAKAKLAWSAMANMAGVG